MDTGQYYHLSQELHVASSGYIVKCKVILYQVSISCHFIETTALSDTEHETCSNISLTNFCEFHGTKPTFTLAVVRIAPFPSGRS